MSFLFKKCAIDSVRDGEMVLHGAIETRKYLERGNVEKAKIALEKMERGANAIGGEIKARYSPLISDYRRIIDKWINRSFAFVEFKSEGGVKEVERVHAKYNSPDFDMIVYRYIKKLEDAKKNAPVKVYKPKDDDDHLE